MSTNTLDAVETKISLPKYLAEKIQRTNYSLTAVMHNVLARYSDAEAFFGVSFENMETFKAHALPKAKLMNMPFLALSPSSAGSSRLGNVCRRDNVLTARSNSCRQRCPFVDDVTARDIFHYNCTYVSLLKDVLHQNVLAAPLLGISFELAEYLMGLPIGRLEAAIGANHASRCIRWRFDDAALLERIRARMAHRRVGRALRHAHVEPQVERAAVQELSGPICGSTALSVTSTRDC